MDPGVAGILSFFLLLSAMCFVLWENKRKRAQLPPGPAPWPLLGNLGQKDVLPLYKSYRKLSREYGPVFTVWVGPTPRVVLCGYEAVRDALVGHAEEFGGRGAMPVHQRVAKGYGLITSSEKIWKVLHRFTIATLRDFGMGKKVIAQHVQDEAQYLVETMANMHAGQASDLLPSIRHAICNVVCVIVFGSRFDYEDGDFLKLVHMMSNYTQYLLSPFAQGYNAFPGLLRYLPGPHNKGFVESERLKSLIQKRIDSCKQALELSQPRSYIDCFLIQSQQGQGTGTSGDAFSEENLLLAVFDLLGAGTVTSVNSLLFFLLGMARFPHIQARVQQEIDAVVGTVRAPSVEDRMKLPYTNAVIHELQRSHSTESETIPRAMTQRTEFWGYTLPQGTTVVPVLSSVHSDPKHWETPDAFNPGHFLDEEGRFRSHEAFMPFSAGKRMCPGEGLARLELFLFFSTLLQNFTFKTAADPKDMDIMSLWLDSQNKGPFSKLHVVRRKASS